MTEQQLKNRIANLEQWLQDNHAEHEARPHHEHELQKAKEHLSKLMEWPIERDTLDISQFIFR